MKHYAKLAFYLIAPAVLANTGNAAVITTSFHISASGFPSGAAVDPVSGDFSITFDNSGLISGQTTGIVVTNFTEPYSGTIGFSYDNVNDQLAIGTSTAPDFCVVGNGAFCFFVRGASTGRLRNNSEFFDSVTGEPSATLQIISTATVPEPASWAMFIGGVGLVGAAMRRKKFAVRFV